MRSSRKNSFIDFIRSKTTYDRNVGLRHIIGLVVIAVIFSVFATPPAIGQGLPCTQCGPGAHWVDSCSPGQDSIADQGAVVGIDLNLDPSCLPDINLILRPCSEPDNVLVINRSEPRDTSQNFPGLRPHDGHLDVIDTEILSMCMTGSGYTLRAGQGLGLARSLGAVAEQPGDPKLAESFFDVFFVVQTPYGPLYNQTPLRLAAVINCVPPKAAYIHPTGCLPLFTSPMPGQGQHLANLVTAQHIVNMPKGACCIDSSCSDGLTAAACNAMGGSYMGDGSSCSTVNCPTLTPWGVLVLVALIVVSAWALLKRKKVIGVKV